MSTIKNIQARENFVKPLMLVFICLCTGGVVQREAAAQIALPENEFVNALNERDLTQSNRLNQLGPRTGLSLAPRERAPQSVYKTTFESAPGYSGIGLTTCWRSDSICVYNPIFQETELERYGLAKGSLPKQNVESGFKFFVKGTLLPLSLLRGRQRETSIAPF